jgi:hypothetical protein
MCKELPVILVNIGGGPEKDNWKKWRAEEEERHKGSLNKKVYIRSLHTFIFIQEKWALYFLFINRRNYVELYIVHS